jgi:cytochrome c
MRFPVALASTITAAALLLAAHNARGEMPGAPDAQAVSPPASFGQCKACHSVAKGGPSGVGPNLFGVVGAAAAAKPGFAYSPAMKAAKIRWDRARLDAYLGDPKGVVPGTRMTIPGIKDPARRKEIIDYLAGLK